MPAVTINLGKTVILKFYPLSQHFGLGMRYKSTIAGNTVGQDWDKIIADLGGRVPSSTLHYIPAGNPWKLWLFLPFTPLPGQFIRISIDNLGSGWELFLESIPVSWRPKVKIVIDHEQEGNNYPSPEAYTTKFTNMRNQIKRVAPWAQVGFSSAGSQYRPSRHCYNLKGEWLPLDADFASLDMYQTGGPNTYDRLTELEQYEPFISWDRQRELRLPDTIWYYTEYGRLLNHISTPALETRREVVIRTDVNYLYERGDCGGIIYFDSEGPESVSGDRNWRPKDEINFNNYWSELMDRYTV